jgi:2-phosphosulfolactate phosphatase
MKINVILCPSQVDELYFTGKVTVVIDVLRATSTIIEALNNGAKEVIPVNSFEFAVKASGNLFGGNTLLGGERNTKKIDSFNLGNSPLEYSRKVVQGKSIILFTTNGSKAIVKARFSDSLILSSFTNISSAANYLSHINKDVEILCSGRNEGFSIEDTICAGRIILELGKMIDGLVLSDPAKASVVLSNSYGNDIRKILYESEHGNILLTNGFENDIIYCSEVNAIKIIPIYHEGVIKTYSEELA